MIITKEQQEAWIDTYIKQGHTQDECIGFIDGIEKAMSIVKNCNAPDVIKSVCEYGMNPDDCIRKADTCFKCLKDD